MSGDEAQLPGEVERGGTEQLDSALLLALLARPTVDGDERSVGEFNRRTETEDGRYEIGVGVLFWEGLETVGNGSLWPRRRGVSAGASLAVGVALGVVDVGTRACKGLAALRSGERERTGLVPRALDVCGLSVARTLPETP